MVVTVQIEAQHRLGLYGSADRAAWNTRAWKLITINWNWTALKVF